ncbi:MAG: hypothetical protein F7C35_02340 [Desulfurococcales archaeon]|nr:hypothetical protein [Desulfurococcales archaeon]
MTTAREAFEAKKLAAKYGVVGKVAARYRTAGYQVVVKTTDEAAPFHFTATRKGEKLLVKVFHRVGQVPVEEVEKLAGAGEGKKVLVLYGAGPKLSGEVTNKAKEVGVSIRRVRA